jgi:hypothetical protein
MKTVFGILRRSSTARAGRPARLGRQQREPSPGAGKKVAFRGSVKHTPKLEAYEMLRLDLVTRKIKT